MEEDAGVTRAGKISSVKRQKCREKRGGSNESMRGITPIAPHPKPSRLDPVPGSGSAALGNVRGGGGGLVVE